MAWIADLQSTKICIFSIVIVVYSLNVIYVAVSVFSFLLQVPDAWPCVSGRIISRFFMSCSPITIPRIWFSLTVVRVVFHQL